MKSSQALAQSVFATLKVYNRLHLLRGLCGDSGRPLFIVGSDSRNNCTLEYDVTYLGEPRPTNVDIFFDGDCRIAVECKLAETEVGSCSRPRLAPRDSDYDPDYCDGRYAAQRGREKRCSLGAIGVNYWDYIPPLFRWPADVDHDPCPLRETYQIIRNILAACVRPDGRLAPDSGHAVLLYDERNPAFADGGKAFQAWNRAKVALKQPSLLQTCTWQKVIECLRADHHLDWLSEGLREKYGL